MSTMTVTDFSRNLRQVLDGMQLHRETIVLIRNNKPIARIIPGAPEMTALEAMGDLYRTLPEEAGASWAAESAIGSSLEKETRDPWAT